MKERLSKINYFIKCALFFVAVLVTAQSFAQKKKKKGLFDDIIKGAQDVTQGARVLTGATNEVNNTVKSVKALKKTWEKDTSSNIKYKQVPDYRTREEVTIEKTQKLLLENGEFKNFQWTPATYFQNEVFPSFIIGWSSYKGIKTEDMGSSLGFNLNNQLSKPVTFKWEVECNDKSYFNIDSGYISAGARQNFRFMPKIAWNYKTLTRHQTAAPLNIRFRLIDPLTGNKVEKLATISLRSINDCVRFYNNEDLRFMYTAYVNEDHPEIDNILKDALRTGMVKDFSGYQHNDQKYVLLQVAAINRVLHDRGFKYSDITDNSGIDDGVLHSQSIRTFDNAIKTTQANCVDGTVVFASILKKIGITPVIILIPGHCFLGYFISDTQSFENLRFLETTSLSNDEYLVNPKKSVADNKSVLESYLPKAIKLDEKNKAYYLQFLRASQDAEKEFTEAKAANASIKTFNVTEWRKSIRPIPVYF